MNAAAAPTGKRGPYANTPRRKSEIVAAAAHVFSETGYHGGSLRQIARDLGLSFTSVKHHFPTKEGLLLAVLEANDAMRLTQLATDRDIAGMSFVDSVIAMATRKLERPESLRLFALLAAEASAPSHPAHAWFVRHYRVVRDQMADAITRDVADGRLHEIVDAGRAAGAILALWDGLQLQWLIDPWLDMPGDLKRGAVGILQSFASADPAPDSWRR